MAPVFVVDSKAAAGERRNRNTQQPTLATQRRDTQRYDVPSPVTMGRVLGRLAWFPEVPREMRASSPARPNGPTPSSSMESNATRMGSR